MEITKYLPQSLDTSSVYQPARIWEVQRNWECEQHCFW